MLRNLSVLCLLIVMSTAVALAGFEIYYRHKLVNDDVQRASQMLVIHSQDILSDQRAKIRFSENELYLPIPAEELRKANPHIGHFNQNQDVKAWFLDKNNHIVFQCKFRINNLGFLSAKDYSVKRSGKEYRIAMLGDSITGADTMDHPWVDQVEDILDHDADLKRLLGVDSIKVFNFGQPGAGFGQFMENYFNQAKLFAPDMVVINYIETDFPRGYSPPQPLPPDAQTRPKLYGTGWITYKARPGDTEEAKLYTMCTAPPISLKNPTCTTGSFLIMPEALVHDPDRVQAIRTAVVNDYISAGIHWGWIPWGLMAFIGHPVTVSELRSGAAQKKFHQFLEHALGHFGLESIISHAKAAEVEALGSGVASAGSHLLRIINDHPNVLLTLSTLYWDVFPSRIAYEKTAALRRIDPRLDPVVLRNILPIPKSAKEFKTWFNLPWDGHLSDRGGRIYAQAMSCVIRNRILVQHHMSPQKCVIDTR
jgi:hypothetical protein